MAEPIWDAEFVECVVQEVIRRLLERSVTVDPASPATLPTELRLQQKVVTLAALPRQLNGVGRLIIEPRAVVTPAVKDKLRDEGIELVRRAAESLAAG